MTSPTKEGSDQADNDLKNCDNEAPNVSNSDVEPSLAEPSVISQVESNPVDREPGASTSQEHAASPIVEGSELESEKTQQGPQNDDLTENSHLVHILLPRKLCSLLSGLHRITYLSIPVLKLHKNNFLCDRSKFHPGQTEMKTSDLCHSTMNHKFPLQLIVSGRIPFISDHEMRRMILRLLCGRHFSQTTVRQNTAWVKQKFIAILLGSNVLIHTERPTIFGRPFRVNYYCPFLERMKSGKLNKSTDSKEKDESRVFVRPTTYTQRAQIQNAFNRKAFEHHLRSHPNVRAVVISTSNGWKYLCPICGSCFNSFVEFRQHSCNL